MNHRKPTSSRLLRAPLLLAALAAGAASVTCSDDTVRTDLPVFPDAAVDLAPDTAADLPQGDGTQLYPCDVVGEPCDAHDPCAIETECDSDKLCQVTSRQDCDDGHDCTEDICLGMGLCDHALALGYCLIVTPEGPKCFERWESPPDITWKICDDTSDPHGWTPLEGYACDDDDPCTKNDKVKSGVCAGTYYGTDCADDFACTDDLCNGLGGCLGHQLKEGWCQIDGLCYLDGETDITGCQVCDAANSPTAWQPLTSLCLIDGQCYAPGSSEPQGCGICDPDTDPNGWTQPANPCHIAGRCYPEGKLDPTGCGICDPGVSETTWTITANACLINRSCHPAGAQAPSGCASCVPGSSRTAWTAEPGKCLIGGSCYSHLQGDGSGCLQCNTNNTQSAWTAASGTVDNHQFESGELPSSWARAGSDTYVGWTVADRRSTGGSFSLYYGNALEGNYKSEDPSNPNTGTVTLPSINLPSGKKAGVRFMLYMDTETGSSYDVLSVYVGTTKVWSKNDTTVPQMRAWQPVSLDLQSFAGQNVSLRFKFDTVDGGLNSSEGVYIDDLAVYRGCS